MEYSLFSTDDSIFSYKRMVASKLLFECDQSMKVRVKQTFSFRYFEFLHGEFFR